MDNWKSSLAEKCLATYIDRKIKSEVNNFVLCKLQNYLENLIIIIRLKKAICKYARIISQIYTGVSPEHLEKL